jgi:hypothetical protein
MRSSSSLSVFKIHRSSNGRDQAWPRRTSNPQMASPHFPFSHVPSEISFSPSWETKGSPTYDEDYRRPTTDVAEPRVASCIRFDHRRAIHLLQHRSSTSHKDGIRLQRQNTPRTGPHRVGFPAWQDSSTRFETTRSSIEEAY